MENLSQVQYAVHDGVAVLTLSNPPVNSLGFKLRYGIDHYIRVAQKDPSVISIVIIGSGAAFCAGADISEFPAVKKMIQSGKVDPNSKPLPEVVQAVEDSTKPVVAAIHGSALGGGLELALGCHYRIALESAKLGLPEVQLGIIPGAGGTQRLPRLAGFETAMKMIISGSTVSAKVALKSNIIDHVVQANSPSELLKVAISYAKEVLKSGIDLELRRVSHLSVDVIPQMVFDGARAMAAKSARGFLAPQGCVDAIEAAAYSSSFAEGMRKEQEIIARLIMGPQSAAQQYFFFAQRESSKVPGISSKLIKAKGGSIRSVGIIGAGTMGAGIAMNFLQAGVRVVLLDMKQEYIDNGVKGIQRNYESAVKKRRMTSSKVKQIMSYLTTSTDYSSLKDVDMVIEAVFEDMKIKQQVLKRCDEICKPSTLLCTNTSTLDVDEIAKATSRPDKVIGTHFFSPANQMKLLEIVRGADTSVETIAAVLGLSKIIKKVSVVVGNCFGFVGNRMLEWYGREAAYLVEEGASIEQVDRVLFKFGMAMGPFTMSDLAGNDIGFKIRKSLGLTDASKRDPNQRYHGGLGDKLVNMGRLGQKTGKGWYKYEQGNRKPITDPEVSAMIESHRRELGIVPRKISDQEILERCLYPLINDGFNILMERIAIRPSDIDVVYIYGYGFPVYRGGPMFYADTVGLRNLLSSLEKYEAQHPKVGHWKPSPFLRKLVDDNMSLQQFVMMQMKSMRNKAKM